MVARAHTTKPSFSKASTLTVHCTYCKKAGHTANRCFKRLDDLDGKNSANYANDTPVEIEADIALLALDDDLGPDSWAF